MKVYQLSDELIFSTKSMRREGNEKLGSGLGFGINFVNLGYLLTSNVFTPITSEI